MRKKCWTKNVGRNMAKKSVMQDMVRGLLDRGEVELKDIGVA